MDSFGNYPREKFDPFSVMLFKALQVVAFLFFIALLVMNPEAKSGKIDTKAEFIITLTWPDSHPDDIDLYRRTPSATSSGITRARLVSWCSTATTAAGQQHHRRERQEDLEPDPAGDGEHSRYRAGRIHRQRQPLSRHDRAPVPVAVKVEKVNPAVEVVHYDT